MQTSENTSRTSRLDTAGGTSPVYRSYVLMIFVLVYTFNFVDRQILAILAEPIKAELGLMDWQLGFLTGTAFALFYATLGIPIARLADRWHRVNIMSAALAIWSAMTALCGLAANFTQLAAARIGVGIGEAGGSPPAVSMIADYFPREQRATAMGIYSLGPTLGTLVGFIAGGWVSEIYGWRTAFIVVGLPGLALALIAKMTVREPVRGQSEAATGGGEPTDFRQSLATLFSIGTYRLVTLAGAAAAVAVYGFMIWTPALLIRKYGLSTGEVGSAIGVIAGFAGGAGTLLGGYAADFLSRRNRQWQMRVPALTMLLFFPLVICALNAPSVTIAYILLVPTYLTALAYTGPTWATLQTVAPLHMRALAAAIFLFVINLIGLGMGPQLIGILSDLLAPTFGTIALGHAIGGVAIFSIVAALLFYKASLENEWKSAG